MNNQWIFLTLILIIILYFNRIFGSSESPDESQVYGEIFPEKSRNLLVFSQRDSLSKHKCHREISAKFFQTIKNEPVQGNGSTKLLHRIEVCCTGYVRSRHDWQKCIPDCSETPFNCRNGFCRSSNKCECFEEFVLNDHGECVHTCPIECENGRCFLNGTCVCHRGYILDQRTRKFCRPECSEGCAYNQECISPEKCDCKRGYRRTNEYGCQPICAPDCGYGKCVGPNKFECFPGYTKRFGKNACEAECNINCENGFCESYYKCQCRDGYIYDPQTTNCLPDCGNECENGVCIEPGLCKCFNGYQLKGRSCEPACNTDCGFYGSCIDVNICGCSISKQFCQNGSCDSMGRCQCKFGQTHFIDRCIDPHSLNDLINTYQQREYFNKIFNLEFENLIGNMFQFLS